MRPHKIFKRLLMLFGILIIVCGLAFSVYVSDYNKSNVSLEDYDNVTVKNNDFIIKAKDAKAKILFYPGAKVEKKAYLPLAEKLVDYEYDVVILDMPFKLAFFDSSAAKEYTDSSLPVYLMGHSLGGAMAASYVSSRSDIKGLILLASYATKEFVNKDLLTLSIYGSNDSVLSLDSYKDNLNLLPNCTEVVIEGGNHSGFGDYGLQSKDTKSTISGDEQKSITAKKINEFIGG